MLETWLIRSRARSLRCGLAAASLSWIRPSPATQWQGQGVEIDTWVDGNCVKRSSK
jgi:hypothetical protein